MIKRSHISRLRDIVESIDAIEDMMDGASFAAYQSSFQLRKAVERCLEIISEASRSVPSEMKDQYPAIPWRAIADIGNLLRHDYQRVDDFVVWSAATRSLADLRVSVAALLSNEK